MGEIILSLGCPWHAPFTCVHNDGENGEEADAFAPLKLHVSGDVPEDIGGKSMVTDRIAIAKAAIVNSMYTFSIDSAGEC
jgi:hypothetical protein